MRHRQLEKRLAAAAAPDLMLPLVVAALVVATAAATPPPAAAATAPPPPPTTARASGGIVDISVAVDTGLPVWESAAGLRRTWRQRYQQIEDGDVVNQSFLWLDAHTSTHIDAPLHFLADGKPLEQLDLAALLGDALVVDVPPDTNITAAFLERAGLPNGATRLLFKTQNSARRLMHTRAFDPSYTALDSTAAALLGKAGVRLVGIDYLSIGVLEDIVETHRTLFRHDVIAVEGLDLAGVEPGWWRLACLPVKLAGSDGAPARCVLQPPSATAAGEKAAGGGGGGGGNDEL